ncbi:TonB-dependent receptor plug domain-containing protein, partial [Klebsiella pneumoniae]
RTISDVLKSVPGISVDTSGQGNIDLRGQGAETSQRNLQVLLDGAPITTLANHPYTTNYDIIPVEQLERIEIIPGG